MHRITFIKSLVAILLLSFIGQGVGQVFASVTMQCQSADMMPLEHQQMMVSDAVTLSQGLQALASSDAIDSELCFQCDCVAGNGTSAVLPMSHIQFTQATAGSYRNYSDQATSLFSVSLYRPPILR